MAALDSDLLTQVFGVESSGSTKQERARTSRRCFVRSQDHLAIDSPGATGHRISATEALESYGWEKLLECVEFGSAVLAASREEPARTLRERRRDLGLNAQTIAKASRVDATMVEKAEHSTSRTPIDALERIAIALGLDERLIATRAGSGGDKRLAARLRSLTDARPAFSQNVVATFAHAAWVIRTQHRLWSLIGGRPDVYFEPDSNYGNAAYPVWQHGYFLATKTRDLLDLGRDPIESIRTLCANLRIPVLLGTLPKSFAGATLESGEGRGIVVNTIGANQNVWVRRATVAHELGHMLWDPAEHLETVRVDEYADLDRHGEVFDQDFVEARANAFMIEFLAPSSAVEDKFRQHSDPSTGLRRVMEDFGISFTAARFHLKNVLGSSIDPGTSLSVPIDPTPEWQGRESYTDDYFPLPETSQLRRGEFAGLVVAAEQSHFISMNTAANYLETTIESYRRSANQIAELFPDIVG